MHRSVDDNLAVIFLPLLICFALSPGLFSQQSGNSMAGAAAMRNWSDHTVHDLTEHGVSFQYTSVSDVSKSPSNEDYGWFGRYSLDLSAGLDGRKLLGWKGGSGSVDLKQHLQEFGRPYDGVSQAYSNIDGGSRTTLYQAWAQQSLFTDRLQMRAGKMDANTQFDVVATAADFLNSSMGYSPTIMEFPTYPEPKPGGEVSISLGSGLGMSTGVFRTARGKMGLAEGSYRWVPGSDRDSGRVSAGYWNLRESLTRFDGDQTASTQGYWGVAEQLFELRRRQLATYAQIGTGDGRENEYTRHLGAGVVMAAPFSSRKGDAAGLGMTQVRFTRDPDCGFDAGMELALESYYKLRLGQSVSLIGDTQYFRHPGGMRERPDYVVVTPRLTVSF
jgi:porin